YRHAIVTDRVHHHLRFLGDTLLSERRQCARRAYDILAGVALIKAEDPGPFEMVTGLQNAALLAFDAPPALREALAQGVAVKKQPVEERGDLAGLIQKALLARRFEERKARFDEMHVRVLKPRARRRQPLPEAAAGSGHFPLHEIERLMCELPRLLVFGQ